MTAAGLAQATAAEAIRPSLAALNRSLAHARKASPADCAMIASHVHGCLGTIATAVNDTGYAAAGQWAGQFLQGQAADPGWLRDNAYRAAELIQTGANLTVAVRAVRGARGGVKLPVVAAANAASTACHGLGELIVAHRRSRTLPQVPEYAAVLAALRAACDPLAAAAAAVAPRLDGVEPDWTSVWCEDFEGDLPAAFRAAALRCAAGGRALGPVCERAAADVVVWRSRSRHRPGS